MISVSPRGRFMLIVFGGYVVLGLAAKLLEPTYEPSKADYAEVRETFDIYARCRDAGGSERVCWGEE